MTTAADLHRRALVEAAAGNVDAAITLLRDAVRMQPENADLLINLAVLLKGRTTVDERLEIYRRALQLTQEDAVLHANFSAALVEAGNFGSAELHARSALSLEPDRVDAHLNLGNALAGLRRYQQAAASFTRAWQLQPGLWQALLSGAKANLEARQYTLAHQQLGELLNLLRALPAQPEQVLAMTQAHALSGDLHTALNHHEAATQDYRRALVLQPDDSQLMSRLADSLFTQDRYQDALFYYTRLAEQEPDSPHRHIDLGRVAHSLGDYESALGHFHTALELDQTNLPTYSNIATSITYSPLHFPEQLKHIYRRLDRLVMAPLRDWRPHANVRDAHRPLRVGYVSPDFRKHVAAYFALPLLEGHDPAAIEVSCYYNNAQQDEWTERFQRVATNWVNCVDMTNAELAERIREDRIDILVDLAGHTQGNRLRMFARKPAPVQVTWMGYVTTTGVSAIDYRLTHADADPPGVDQDYTETLIRLPRTLWCYRPLPDMPAVAESPCLRNGYVTLGGFNRFSKVGARVLDCWAAIMAAVPQSRLVLYVPVGPVRDQVVAQFSAAGIAPSRLQLFARVSHAEFWALHHQVDLALDTFPFNGGTTTCETLWMGVPIVTCSGGTGSFPPRHASRLGFAMLKALGLEALATLDESAYVAEAIKLASDPARLVSLRNSLRTRMQASPLMDERGFVAAVETAYRGMWQCWLQNGEPVACNRLVQPL